MVPYVDILIPSKDRPMQLHLLLESMAKHLKCMGRITISWQGSTEDYISGYQLLRQRVFQDEAFASLRKNSKEIVFKRRSSLTEVYEAAMNTGDSDYIMPLVDDDVFLKEYDLVNHPASRYFFDNSDVLSCAIRLGDNLTDQVSVTAGDGVASDMPRGHAASLFSTGKPRFIIPKYSHWLRLNDCNDWDYLLWAWPENLNVPHWSCFFSTTGQIYRRAMYIDFFDRFGKDNFLKIEGKGFLYFLQEHLELSPISFGLLRLTDKVLMKIQTKYGIYGQELLSILLAKYIHRKRTNKHGKSRVPYLMVCPSKSVVCNLDTGHSHDRGNLSNASLIEEYNRLYLDGLVISYERIPIDKIVFSNHIFQDFEMRKY